MSDAVDVSVVIPAFNCVSVLPRCIASVLRQSARAGEIIIVDDASTDNTRTIAESLAREARGQDIQVITHDRNMGPASARNSGWDTARGRFVAFLDADDTWHPRKLEIQREWMVRHPDVGLSGHGCPEERPDCPPQPIAEAPSTRIIKRRELLVKNQFSTPTVMIRRDLPYRFEPTKRYAEDYLLWLQICLDHVPIAYIDAPLAAIHKAAYGASGLSSRLWKMERGELEVYWQLRRERRLGSLLACSLAGLSIAKYVRRRIRVAFRPSTQKVQCVEDRD